MAKFDNAAFVKLVWKNERRIINPKTPKDIREGIDFFRAGYGGLSQSSKKTLEFASERCERALNAMGLSFDYKFPDDPVLKNKVWKEQVQPRMKELQEIFKYEKLAKDLKLPKNATKKKSKSYWRQSGKRSVAALQKRKRARKRLSRKKQKQKELFSA